MKIFFVAQNVFDDLGPSQTNFGTVNWSYRALRTLQMARANLQSRTQNLKASIVSATHALKLTEETLRTWHTYERDYVEAHWLLGAAYCASGNLAQTEIHLSEALTDCRAINLVNLEANILLDMARLHYAQEKPEEAKTLAEEALLITERCGYVLQGADVHLFLVQFALEQEKDKEKAKARSRKTTGRASGTPISSNSRKRKSCSRPC